MADRRVKVGLELEASGFEAGAKRAQRAAEGLGSATEKVGEDAKKAAAASERASQQMAAAQEKARVAQDKAADAVGRLRVAQERLEAARGSGNAARIAAAEEAVAKAQRDVESTARRAADAHAAYEDAAGRAEVAARELGDEMDKASSKSGRFADGIRSNSADLQTAGTALAAVGAGLTAASVGAGKAAMDWESAFAGVKKTVDDSTEGYAQLEGELRNLATTLPASHQEIAAVAEAAGQLGVKRDDIVGFTATMIDLGETTNLTADEAATNIAQISNVMGTMDREGSEGVARFGAALVELGNNGASTEKEILDMAQRIAGAASTVGASESDVLALSNTLASMGIRAEQGGGVATRVILKMRSAVDEGGESLETFAQVAGTSAEEFAAKFRSAPMEALDLVAQGIGRVNTEGGNVTATLADMGIKGTEETQVMLALASAGDLLSESLRMGDEAWASNSALAAEAAKRYETSEARIRMAWNGIMDAAIDAGGAILPVAADLAESVATVVGAFQSLPDPIKEGLGAVAGIGGVALTAAGGFMVLAPRVLEAKDALARLTGKASAAPVQIDAVGVAAERSTRKLTPFGKAVFGVGKALGGLATAAAAGITIGAFVPSGATAEADALAAAVTRIGTGGEQAALGIDELNKAFTGKGNWFDGLDVQGIDEAFRIMGNPSVADNVDQIASKVLTFGTRSSTNVEFAKKNFEALDQQLAGMAQGGSLDAAKATFEQLSEAAKAQGVEQEKVNELFPAYAAALSRAEAEAAAAASSTGEAAGATDALAAALGDAAGPASDTAESLGALGQVDAGSNVGGIAEAMGVLTDEATELDDKLDGVLDALTRMGVLESNAISATMGYQEALENLATTAAENAATLDLTTEAGRNNMSALQGLADAGRDLLDANARAGESQGTLRDGLIDTYNTLVENAQAMGQSATEADALARKLMGIPANVDVETYLSDAALVAAEATGNAIEAIPGYRGVTVAVTADGTVGEVQASIDQVDGKTVYMYVTTDGTKEQVQQEIREINGKQVPVWVTDDGTVVGTQEDIFAITGKNVDISAIAHTGDAEGALNYAARNRTVSIFAKYVGMPSAEDRTNWARNNTTGIFPNRAKGGIASLRGYSTGGRLPYTGRGTDMILGVTGSGTPIARVDDGEWIINQKASKQFHGVLSAINRGDPSVKHLAGYAGGGRAGREWSAAAVNPVVNVTTPAAPGLDAGALEAAVASGMARYRPVFKMGSYEVAGVMRDAQDYMGGW